MTVLVVPTKAYEKALRVAPRSLWGWADLQPGRAYGLVLLPWASWEERVRAEDALEELKKAIKKKKRGA